MKNYILNEIFLMSPFDRFAAACEGSKNVYSVTLSSGGHYFLECNDELLVCDSACEDLYEEDTAYCIFANAVAEHEGRPDLIL